MESIDKYVWYQEGPGVRKKQYTSDGIKLLNVANLVDGKIDLSTSNRYISEEEAKGKYNHFLVDEGDLIIASSGIQVDYFDKKMGFAQKEHLPLCMNTSTIRFKILNDKITNIRYFMYFLKSNFFKKQLKKLITGSAQLNFGPSHLKKIKIYMPLLENQIQVINKLDKVQEMIDIRKKQIDKLHELIKSQFVEMFGNPLINEKKWKQEKLGDVCILKAGRAIKADELSNYKKNENYPCFGGNGIRGYINKFSHEGNIPLIGRQGALCGNVNYAQGKFYATEHAVTVIPVKNEEFNPYWLYYTLKMMDLNRLAIGVAQPGLTVGKLNQEKIIIVEKSLQDKFSKIVEQIDKQKLEIEKNLKEMQELYESLMEKYFG